MPAGLHDGVESSDTSRSADDAGVFHADDAAETDTEPSCVRAERAASTVWEWADSCAAEVAEAGEGACECEAAAACSGLVEGSAGSARGVLLGCRGSGPRVDALSSPWLAPPPPPPAPWPRATALSLPHRAPNTTGDPDEMSPPPPATRLNLQPRSESVAFGSSLSLEGGMDASAGDPPRCCSNAGAGRSGAAPAAATV